MIIVLGLLFVSCVIVLMLGVVRSTLKTNPYKSIETKNVSTESADSTTSLVSLMKLLINHVQQSSIFFAFSIPWPQAVSVLFSMFDSTANVGESALSL